MKCSPNTFSVVLSLAIAATAVGDEKHNTNFSGHSNPVESDFYRLDGNGAAEIAVIRDGSVKRLGREDLQADIIGQDSQVVLIVASEMTDTADGLIAQNCEILMRFRQTWVRGKASNFQFTKESQKATLENAELRMTVAVAGPDLTDVSKLTAQELTIDLKNSRIDMKAGAANFDLSKRVTRPDSQGFEEAR